MSAQLSVYNVTLLFPEKTEFVRTDVVASNNIRAYLKALKASKWKDSDPDTILYHTEKIADFPMKTGC